MWKNMSSWIERLDFLPGLTLEEKARARVILLSKPREDRPLYFSGTYAEAAATIQALLRETPLVPLGASASLTSSDASALSLPSCCTTTTITRDSITTSRSGATASSSGSAPSATTGGSASTSASSSSRRPPASELLARTAASLRDLGALPNAFRAAHFWASVPGDVYCRTVKKFVPFVIPNSGGGGGGDGDADGGLRTVMLERGETRFAMVVNVTQPAKDGSAPGVVIAVRIRASEVSRRWRRPPSPTPSHIGSIGGGAATAWEEQQQSQEVEGPDEYESEVVPDPRDSLEAALARLDRREVRVAEVLWWEKRPGKWALWDGEPQRAWCVAT